MEIVKLSTEQQKLKALSELPKEELESILQKKSDEYTKTMEKLKRELEIVVSALHYVNVKSQIS
jgi:hypothetical protein